MAFAKFQENRFRIDGEIAKNHAILVNLMASIALNTPHLLLLSRFCPGETGSSSCEYPLHPLSQGGLALTAVDDGGRRRRLWKKSNIATLSHTPASSDDEK